MRQAVAAASSGASNVSTAASADKGGSGEGRAGGGAANEDRLSLRPIIRLHTELLG